MNSRSTGPASLPRVLVVDDEEAMCSSLKALLEREGLEADTAASVRDAFSLLRRHRYNLVICDVRMPEMGGISLLAKIRGELPVIMITAYASIETARSVFKLGACDYLTKPFKFEELLVMVQQYMLKSPRGEGSPRVDFFLDSKSPRLAGAYELARKFAPTDMPILVTGESGSGKEIVADYIYHLSRDRARSYVKINCAAIPEALLEGELFGYERGAFTGAVSGKAGKIEEADGGILFLDEIGDMPFVLQSKMLRVLQDFQLSRLGSNEPKSIRTRVIAASNQNLERLVSEGRFRLDLYHRLLGVHIEIPALRERLEDMEDLALFFVERFDAKYGKRITSISEGALEIFRCYPWPGNIRELKFALERAVVVCEGETILPDNLADSLRDYSGAAPAGCGSDTPGRVTVEDLPQALDDYRNEYMRKVILAALEKTGGNKAEVAKMLNISRKTLYNRMKDLNIRHEFI